MPIQNFNNVLLVTPLANKLRLSQNLCHFTSHLHNLIVSMAVACRCSVNRFDGTFEPPTWCYFVPTDTVRILQTTPSSTFSAPHLDVSASSRCCTFEFKFYLLSDYNVSCIWLYLPLYSKSSTNKFIQILMRFDWLYQHKIWLRVKTSFAIEFNYVAYSIWIINFLFKQVCDVCLRVWVSWFPILYTSLVSSFSQRHYIGVLPW
jgi:hypothetical protein